MPALDLQFPIRLFEASTTPWHGPIDLVPEVPLPLRIYGTSSDPSVLPPDPHNAMIGTALYGMLALLLWLALRRRLAREMNRLPMTPVPAPPLAKDGASSVA